MTGVRIREARIEDLPTMADLKRRAGIVAWSHILPMATLERLGLPDRWREVVAAAPPRTTALVAEIDGLVVGFAILRPSDDEDASEATGELDGLYADPGHWGLGAGRRLLAAAVEALRDLGFADATLWTAVENHRPRRVYERAGWRNDGATRRRSLEDVDFEEVRYRRELPALEQT